MSRPLSRSFKLRGSVLLTALLAVGGVLQAQAGPAAKLIRIGLFTPLSGDEAEGGKTRFAAASIAQQELNAEFAARRAAWRVQVVGMDTQGDPNLALERLREFRGGDYPTVAGPFSSAELAVMKPYADAHNILVVSPDSTARSLAVAGDNIYRFCPSDGSEAQAISTLLKADGIKTIVPIWLGDAGNDSMHDSMLLAFLATGGLVTAGARYTAVPSDFSPLLDTLEQQVTAAQNAGNGPVAIFYAGLGESVQLLKQAAARPLLGSVRWYGSDGTVQNPDLTADADASAFAQSVGFVCASLGLEPETQSIWAPLKAKIAVQTGSQPDNYTLGYYDAVRVAAMARVSGKSPRIANRRAAFEQAANHYIGATGWTLLNAAGDRQIAIYDFYAVKASGAGYVWEKTLSYRDGLLTH